ncbi:MAG: o-succinylbenzoate--CoA ligase [Anaerolineae bacterium]
MNDWLTQAAERHRDRLALKEASGAEWSYRALSHRVDSMAARLASQGVAPGSRVGWLGKGAGNGVTMLFALARLGAVFVPLNTRLTSAELSALVGIADLNLLLCERATEANAAQLASQCKVVVVDDLPEASGKAYMAGVVPDSVQSIVFTSGTTGTPKGAQISWANQQASAEASAERIGAHETDRWLLTLPLFHVGGMTIPFRAALSGAVVIEFSALGGFDAQRLMHTLHDERITHVSLVPTMLTRLLDVGFKPYSDLRVILLGGAAATVDLLERAFTAGLPVAPTYGLTEACSQVATMRPEEARRNLGSVGKPLRGTSVTITRDDGSVAAPGEIGEVVVRGPTVFAGYISVPHDRALRDGALYTGDMGYLDNDGDLFLVQRRADLIISGGENIYPAEVEAVLRSHPDVADACVVGLPDVEWGQKVAAAVVLKANTQPDTLSLDCWCRERIAGYKRPRLFRVVNQLPMTTTGKVLRREVVAMLNDA